ncbi:MAG: TolC family protein [Methylocystis sp.]|nr:TolC family protein [Methylocystis sp.]MBI3274765.1 TolC family protein [Methylocystis sp.]
MGRLAAMGAITASLWLSPLEAKERQAEQRQPPGATVESVVALARRLSPELAAAALDAEAAVHKIGAAGVLADPTINLEAWDVNGHQGIGQRRIGVEQEFKLWGKRDLEREIAQADAEAAKHQSSAADTDLIARVKTVYAEYCAAHQAVDLSIGLKRRVDELLGLLRLRYGATSVDQQEVIKAEIEAATAEADVVRRQGETKSAAARLNALVGRHPQAALAAPNGFRPLKANVTMAGVQARAWAANPLLAATAAQVDAATGAKSLADLNYYPEVTLGARYVQRPRGEDTGEFLLGFKVPLQYEAKDAEQRAASSRLGAAQARSDAIRIRLDGDVVDAWFGFDAVRKAIRIYEQRQLPPARLSVETARSGFQAGTTDLSVVLEAERRLRTIQLDLLKLKVESQAKYAELERLAGGSL